MQVHWIQEIVKQGIVIPKWNPKTKQMADRLKKALEQILF